MVFAWPHIEGLLLDGLGQPETCSTEFSLVLVIRLPAPNLFGSGSRIGYTSYCFHQHGSLSFPLTWQEAILQMTNQLFDVMVVKLRSYWFCMHKNISVLFSCLKGSIPIPIWYHLSHKWSNDWPPFSLVFLLTVPECLLLAWPYYPIPHLWGICLRIKSL